MRSNHSRQHERSRLLEISSKQFNVSRWTLAELVRDFALVVQLSVAIVERSKIVSILDHKSTSNEGSVNSSDRMIRSVWRGAATTRHVAAKVLTLSTGVIFAYAILALSAESARGIEVLRTVFFDDHRASPGPPGDRPIRAELVVGDKMPIAYFLDRVPDDVDLPTVPNSATDIVVAKVRLQEAPSYLGGRDKSGEPPKNLSKDIFFTRVKISDVRRGGAAIGQIFDVRFGLRGDKRRLIYPYTPDQLGREYMVVMYLDVADGQHRLAPFSITELQYSQWETEQSAYTRLRGKPGFRE